MRERTVALIKPDAFRRRLVGEIVSSIEGYDLEIIEARICRWQPHEMAVAFYGRQHHGRPYFEALCAFMASGPLMVLLLESDDAIQRWRRLMGPWQEKERARLEMAGTIRGHYMEGDSTMENLVHGSDSRESFLYEAAHFGWLDVVVSA